MNKNKSENQEKQERCKRSTPRRLFNGTSAWKYLVGEAKAVVIFILILPFLYVWGGYNFFKNGVDSSMVRLHNSINGIVLYALLFYLLYKRVIN
jgi:hypothetical protein